MSNAPLPPLPRSTTPWPWLAQSLGLASDPRTVILAAIGLFLAAQGTQLIDGVFQGNGSKPELGFSIEDPTFFIAAPHALLTAFVTPIFALIQPILGVFTADIPAFSRFGHVLAALWTLTVFSLFGCAISRIVVVRLADSPRVSIVEALKFSVLHQRSLLAAPLVVFAVTTGISLFGAVVGLFDRVSPVVASALAFIPLVIGIINAVILLGLLAAWPLMVATVAAEGEDFFDVISRSYSYARQRMTSYLLYLFVSALLGMIGLVLVALFAKTALGLADWSISLGAPTDVGFRFGDELGTDRAAAFGAFWSGLVRGLINGWSASFIFVSTSIIYLLLRRDIDDKEMQEVYIPKPKPTVPSAVTVEEPKAAAEAE